MKWIKPFFTFSNSDRNGIIILMVSIFLIVVGSSIIKKFGAEENFKINHAQIDMIQFPVEAKDSSNYDSSENEHDKQILNSEDNSESPTVELHSFNPNVFNENDWLQFDTPEKTIHTIQHYLQKGGKFKSSDDLKKIYGLSDLLIATIQPFIVFDSESPDHSVNVIQQEKLDLNLADSASIDGLKGVSNYTASKIIKYRNRLGGFISVNQLYEIKGIKPEFLQPVLNQVEVISPLQHFVQINLATQEDLSKHPYLNYIIANNIINYRNQHGVFKNENDLMKIELMTDSLLKKIGPYIKY